MKQNKEVDMEQFSIILLVFVDLQPVYIFFFYLYIEQGECLQISYAKKSFLLVMIFCMFVKMIIIIYPGHRLILYLL